MSPRDVFRLWLLALMSLMLSDDGLEPSEVMAESTERGVRRRPPRAPSTQRSDGRDLAEDEGDGVLVATPVILEQVRAQVLREVLVVHAEVAGASSANLARSLM